MRIFPDVVLVNSEEQKMLSIMVCEVLVIRVGRMICGRSEKDPIVSMKLSVSEFPRGFSKSILKSPSKTTGLFSDAILDRVGARKLSLNAFTDIPGCL